MSIHRLMAKSPFRVLSLTTLRGVFPTIGSASDTLAQFRGLAISLRAPSGDYLIANSPFRHLQEPWHDAAPLRSPRLGPDLPPPPADLAGRRSPGTVNLALAACASASRWVVGWDDDSCSRPLCRLPVPRRDHQPRRLAVFQVPARAAYGRGVASRPRHHRQP